MPSRRELIRMTPAEVRAYLGSQRRIIAVTIGPDGMPHPMPMNYGLDDEGRIILSTFRKSQKVKNVERDPRATLLVESGDSYGELKAAILFADVEIIDEPEQVRALMNLMKAGEVLAESMDEGRNEQVRASVAKRVVLRFTPFRTISWDHGKLGAFY
ncbi:MAG: pyridoxamine 5'-phosphate oxidase family protein [Novosphingobium sp.]